MFLVFKRKSLQHAIIVSLLLIAVSLILGGGVQSAMAKSRELPIYAVSRDDNKIAISFDAAWGADKTRKIVDILKSYNVKATFFLVGFWIDKYPSEVKYIDDNGMEIGNHSLNHLKMSTIGIDTIKSEIVSVNNKIEAIIHKKPKVFRPPFGDYNNMLINEVNSLNMKPVQWDVDSLDWKGISGQQIANRVLKRVKSGSIILCHNNSDHILEALKIIIPDLKSKGYEFVTMSELIFSENYYIDNNGVQHLKSREEK